MNNDVIYEIIENKLDGRVDSYHVRVYTDNTVVVNVELAGHQLRLEGVFKYVSECLNALLDKYSLESEND